MARPNAAAVLLAAFLISPLAGCGSGAPSVSSSTEEVTVKGTVTIGGKPATSGEVIFDPSNVNRKFAASRTAAIGADGSYTVTTLYGENKISVWAPEIKVVIPPKQAVSKTGPRTKAAPAQFAAAANPGPKAPTSSKGSLKANFMDVFVENNSQPITIAVP